MTRLFIVVAALLLAVVLQRVESARAAVPDPLDLDDANNYYTPDGTNNNFENPEFGNVGVRFLYENPTINPVPFDPRQEPSPRLVSNVLFAAPHERPRVTPRNVTDFLTIWAQFIDHDITRTPTGDVAAPIPVPACDRIYDPNCTGTVELPFFRAAVIPGGGEHDHPNAVTAYIDGSQVYGSNINVQNALREFVGGRLKVSKVKLHPEGDYPPRVSEISFKFRQFVNMDNDAHNLPTETLFACGDVRCNEQPLLLSLQILFLREHNRVAGILAEQDPELTDDQLFHRARAYVIATIQHITFNEYLFWLLGGRPFDFPYTGYNPDVSPDIHIVFTAIAFRYGHSEVNNLIKRMVKGQFGDTAKSYFSALSEHYFDNRLTYEDGIGPIFEGMQSAAQSSMDNQAAGAIRNELNRPEGKRYGTDLIAMDIQRAREFGIPRYNELRKVYTIAVFQAFDDPSFDFEFLNVDDEVDANELLNKLTTLYGVPANCDGFSCGLSEDWVEAPASVAHDDYSNLGLLFEAVIMRQFRNIREGDRLWYEDADAAQRLALIIAGTDLQPVKTRFLSDVIRDNVPGVNVRKDVFFNTDLLGQSRIRLGFTEPLAD